MDNSLLIDLHFFLVTIYGGLIAGFIYDIYRTLRHILKPTKFSTYFQDILFWTIITFLFFYILIKINWGELRGYIVLGFFLGIIIYIRIFSNIIFQILIKVGKIIFECMKEIMSIILFPFKFVKRKTSPTLKKMKRIPHEFLNEIKKYKKIISSKK